MKFSKYLLLPFAMACLNLTSVANARSAKLVQLPFNNEAVFSRNHAGLRFDYNMSKNHAKKIICRFSKVYKGYLAFPVHGKLEESGVYGNETDELLILTSKGQTSGNQYRIDPMGSVLINALNGQDGRGSHAKASCHYVG